MPFSAPQGLIAPPLTPFNDDGSVATDLFIDHAHSLLDQGCAALAPFGTTGEALSVGMDERVAGLDALVGAGVDPHDLIPGTGLTNLPDTLRLTRHAIDSGCRAVMTLPPFYIKRPSDDGLVTYFDRLITAAGADDISIVLYHIPQVSGVGFSVDLVARLRREFPDQIVGIKDSSGDWPNTLRLFDISGLTVFPGSELPLVEALELGASGCISATANINAVAISSVINTYRHRGPAAATEVHGAVREARLFVQQYEVVSAQKAYLSARLSESRWANVRPPLVPMPDTIAEEFEVGFSAIG
ncbi:MAG: dihydrodipicolinate synthase family protein [Actinomycetota bacterium]|jgi:4-hydroxy-tetrahydrodipicolinate synthase|nr:dihydrodipicolinate synthase family protein [Actinomycetota bacterium]